ncbi:MAG: hypothetical protein R2797_00120 [Gelidibacter sp.]
MKKRIYFLLFILLGLSFGCSSDDSSSNLNETGQRLLGKWYFGNPAIIGLATNNSFTFTSNGEVTYSYWTGGADNDFYNESGTFNVDGDIMTMTFPEGVELTFVQQVVFENDFKVYFEPVDGSELDAYEGDYFKEGYSEPYEYEIQISGYSSSSQQYPIAITYYWDEESGTLVSQIVNSQTNTDIVNSFNVVAYDKIGFKYDVTGYEESIINSVYITNLDTGSVIFDNSSLEIEDEQVFTLDISEGTYTIQ